MSLKERLKEELIRSLKEKDELKKAGLEEEFTNLIGE